MHAVLPWHAEPLEHTFMHTLVLVSTEMQASPHFPLAMSLLVILAAQPQSECCEQGRVQTPAEGQ